MSCKIGLFSDLHAEPGPVGEALSIFEQQQTHINLCAGDIAGYGSHLSETVHLLKQSQCICIAGNHEIWRARKQSQVVCSKKPQDNDAINELDAYLVSLPRVRHLTFEGVNLYLVHASPPDSILEGIKLLDLQGDLIAEQKAYWESRLNQFNFDVLVVGHTHQVFAEPFGNKLVINPGSTLFNHSCAVLTLPEKRLQWFSLQGKSIKKSWNWGMMANSKLSNPMR